MRKPSANSKKNASTSSKSITPSTPSNSADYSRLLSFDPGLKGGWAFFNHFCLERVNRMPLQRGKIDFDFLKALVDELAPTHIVLERPLTLRRCSRGSIATMFENFGVLKGVLHPRAVSEIDPKEWQVLLEKPASTKAASLYLARRLFPLFETKYDGISDAILIGVYFIQSNASFLFEPENNPPVPPDVRTQIHPEDAPFESL